MVDRHTGRTIKTFALRGGGGTLPENVDQYLKEKGIEQPLWLESPQCPLSDDPISTYPYFRGKGQQKRPQHWPVWRAPLAGTGRSHINYMYFHETEVGTEQQKDLRVRFVRTIGRDVSGGGEVLKTLSDLASKGIKKVRDVASKRLQTLGDYAGTRYLKEYSVVDACHLEIEPISNWEAPDETGKMKLAGRTQTMATTLGGPLATLMQDQMVRQIFLLYLRNMIIRNKKDEQSVRDPDFFKRNDNDPPHFGPRAGCRCALSALWAFSDGVPTHCKNDLCSIHKNSVL